MIVRDGNFTLIDYTPEIQLLPRKWQLISNMNLFTTHYVSTTVAQAGRIQEITTLFGARSRNGERNFIDSENVLAKNFNIPFFPLDRAITAADIQNFRAYQTPNAPKTVQDEVIRVMDRIKRSHALLKERAMVEAIKGSSYVGPNGVGTVYNYYTEFGVSQPLAPVDFTNALVDPSETIETSVRAKITTAAQNEADEYVVVGICSPKWFSALINHPLVREAYKFYQSQQDPLRERLGGLGNYRSFSFKGVSYIEYTSGYITDGEAYFFPTGISDQFRLYYAPANDAALANEVGQELYLWFKQDDFNRKYKVESETSMLAVNTRPELVYKSVGTFSA